MKICDPLLQHTAYSAPHPKGRYDSWSCWPNHWTWSRCWIPTFLQGNKARHGRLTSGHSRQRLGAGQCKQCLLWPSARIYPQGTSKHISPFLNISLKRESNSTISWFNIQESTLLKREWNRTILCTHSLLRQSPCPYVEHIGSVRAVTQCLRFYQDLPGSFPLPAAIN